MTTEILTMPDTAVDNIIVTDTVEDIDEGSKDDNLRHIVRPGDNPWASKIMSDPKGQDVVDIARVRGLEVTALCGKVWVPKSNGAGRDTCDTCMGMAGMIKGGS